MRARRDSIMLGTICWNSSRCNEAAIERGGIMQDGTDVPLHTGRYSHAHRMVSSRGNRGPQTLENLERVRTGSSALAWF